MHRMKSSCRSKALPPHTKITYENSHSIAKLLQGYTVREYVTTLIHIQYHSAASLSQSYHRSFQQCSAPWEYQVPEITSISRTPMAFSRAWWMAKLTLTFYVRTRHVATTYANWDYNDSLIQQVCLGLNLKVEASSRISKIRSYHMCRTAQAISCFIRNKFLTRDRYVATAQWQTFTNVSARKKYDSLRMLWLGLGRIEFVSDPTMNRVKHSSFTLYHVAKVWKMWPLQILRFSNM